MNTYTKHEDMKCPHCGENSDSFDYWADVVDYHGTGPIKFECKCGKKLFAATRVVRTFAVAKKRAEIIGWTDTGGGK